MTENELEIFDRPIDVVNWIKKINDLEFLKKNKVECEYCSSTDLVYDVGNLRLCSLHFEMEVY